jgi:hypothetical protein
MRPTGTLIIRRAFHLRLRTPSGSSCKLTPPAGDEVPV